MILLVAEKPSVATQHYRPMLERCEGESFVKRDGYLEGKNYTITWCVGHLVTLSTFDEYEGYDGMWKLDNLPLIPPQFKLKAIEGTKKQLQIVTRLMEQSDVLINGADAGREGNLIFDLVIDYNPQLREKEIKRLWVNSFVAKDLDPAFKKLESAQHRINLSYAARLRQRADWLVGLNSTRAYTLTAGHGSLLSVGRVQTPTLNLVVKRDNEVETFQELFTYGVVGQWRGYKAQWCREDKIVFFEEDGLPQSVVDKCKGERAGIREIDVVDKKAFPPKPFDLTELQKEANKRFKIKVARVLEVAQQLYEKRYITYPRTDSQYLNDAMKGESYTLAQQLIDDGSRELMRPESDHFVFINSKKVTDHYAIIPTVERPVNLSAEEQKVYSLIVERFVTAWQKPHLWKEYTVQLKCVDEFFRIKLKLDIDLGFKKKQKDDEKKDDDEISNRLENELTWQVGESDPWENLEVHKKKKSKPKYFTEATLLAAMKTAGKNITDESLAEAMKDRGLGTPATQAGIIETLKRREFLQEDKGKIISGPKGRQLIAKVDDRVKSAEMTGEWEYKLTQVEKGNYAPDQFRDDIIEFVTSIFERLREDYVNDFERKDLGGTLGCPKCKKQKLNGVSWGYVCPDEQCLFKLGHAVAQRSLSTEEILSLVNNGITEELSGFKSKRGFEFSAKLKIDEKFEVTFEFSEERSKTEAFKGKCAKCKKENLRESEKVVYCDTDGCELVIFKLVAGLTLEKKYITQLLKKKKCDQIEGFTSRKGTQFSAPLKLNDEWKVVFDFEGSGGGGGKDLGKACPACGDKLKHSDKVIFCSKEKCNVTIWKETGGIALTDEHVTQLIEKRKTVLIRGFKSKKGNLFDAYLVLDVNWKSSYSFD
ncbi:MAG: DNA topoisomerase [Fibrobacterales bacterium]